MLTRTAVCKMDFAVILSRMMHIKLIILVFCFVYTLAIHESFNFVLPPAQRRCFFESLTRDSPSHRVEAFVLSGGNLDILLTFHGPLIEEDILKDYFEDPIFHDMITATKESDSETLTYSTEFKPEKPGTYAICLDNRKSRFMSKVVQVCNDYMKFCYLILCSTVTVLLSYFNTQLDVRPISSKETEKTIDIIDTPKGEEADAAKLKESLSALNVIYKGLTKIQIQQKRDRHRLDLHSETNNSNYSSVFTGSIVETAVFIAVAIFQVHYLCIYIIYYIILYYCVPYVGIP